MSYTIDFKLQTLKLLDKGSQIVNVKDKWQKVADERDVAKRSTVVKWNRQRKEVFAEAEQNRHKKNQGKACRCRKRRHLSSTRSSRAEHCPLTAKLVVSEYKLRRAKGAKVTKMWFCRKMKAKVLQLYGSKAI